jgi:hypothetical protein
MAQTGLPQAPQTPIVVPPQQPRSPIAIIAAVVIAVVVVGFVLGVGVPLAQKSLEQPRITLTDLSGYHSDCSYDWWTGTYDPPQSYTFYFTLRNTGEAAGLADVRFRVGSGLWADRYFVDAHDSVEKAARIVINDCADYGSDWNVWVQSSEKA